MILVQEEIRKRIWIGHPSYLLMLLLIGPNEVVPSWIAADSVRTMREVWEEVAAFGYNVKYHRVPVTRDQSPEDRYLDTYTALIAEIPTSSALVMNCGLGLVRSSFAMSAALMVRRKQVMLERGEDPFGIVPSSRSDDGTGTALERNRGAVRVLQARSEQAMRDRSLLGLMRVLSKSEREPKCSQVSWSWWGTNIFV